jgi:acyl-CoA dehydrogenase family protein 10
MPYHIDQKSPLPGFIGVDFESKGIPTQDKFIEDYVKFYKDFRGNSSSPTELKADSVKSEINLYLSFSFFRIAAILQGVYKRSTMGNASAENAKHMGALAKIMANKGWELAQKHKNRNSVPHISTKVEIGKEKVPPSMRHLVSPRAAEITAAVDEFVKNRIIPVEKEILEWQYTSPDKWSGQHEAIEQLKQEAKTAGLWNLFLPLETDKKMEYGAGLTNLEYATMCEIMGRSLVAPEVFNCSAPDTGK